MDILWVKIQSWHAMAEDGLNTLCGRRAMEIEEHSDTLPAEKSCELCLRILARDVDGDA
jgi:hypothetical protein